MHVGDTDGTVHVGDADGTVAMVDTDDRAADAEMRVDLGGLEDVVEGFFAAASAPSPVTQPGYLGDGGAGA